MKKYPSIPQIEGHYGKHCTAFYKYDGSNIRFEWSKKRGWYKFGTRTRLLDKTDEQFGPAIDLFMQTHASDLEKIFAEDQTFKNAEKITVFCEYYGVKTFCGQRVPNDPQMLVLIDVSIHKKGFLDPTQFLESFGSLGERVAQVVYRGPLTEEFEKLVRDGSILGLFEGVVCKGGSSHSLWMGKIKTDAYKQRLKETFKDNWKDYWE